MSSKNIKLTASIIAKDEELLLENCLRSLDFCDQIVVVVDSKSSDKTEAIAKKYADKVIVRTFDTFAGQKNASIELADGEWVLIVDADERITTELIAEIKAAMTSDEYWGYDIPTKPYVFGNELRHSGWAPSYHLRLFQAEGRYEGAVHEVISAKGPIGKLATPIVHYNYFDVKHYITKLNQYTDLEAIKLRDKSVMFKKHMVITAPAREFAYRYLKQSGYKDGFMGIVIGMMMAFYRLSSVLKLWELDRGSDALTAYRKIDEELLRDRA